MSKDFLNKYGDWVFRILVFLGIYAGLFLNSRYVTRDEFNQVKQTVDETQVTLRLMVEQNKVNERQDAHLADLEQRMRVVERALPRS